MENKSKSIVRSDEAKKFTSDLELLNKDDIIDILSYFYDMTSLEINLKLKYALMRKTPILVDLIPQNWLTKPIYLQNDNTTQLVQFNIA